MKPSLIISFFLLLSGVSFGQSGLRFEHISTNEGLSNQHVNCIFQDAKGFIWIGTAFGLNRYDGTSCKKWYHDDKDTNSLVHNTVLSLDEDTDGNLWIGTQEGISRFNPATESFVNYSVKGKNNFYLSVENCYSFIDKDQTVWLGSNAGAFWLDKKENRFMPVPMELSRPGIARNLFATSFLRDSKNRLWLSTSYGIKRINDDKRSCVSFHYPETGIQKLYVNACTQIVEDKKGRIFCGTWNEGLLYFDEQNQRFQNKKISTTNNAQNVVFQILPVSENNIDYLLLGTFGGLVKVRTDDIFIDSPIKNVSVIQPDQSNKQSISSEVIYALLKDRTGNTWIGTSSGADKLDPFLQQFTTKSLSKDRNSSIEINAMAEGFKSPDKFFFGVSNQLFRADEDISHVNCIAFPAPDITSVCKGKNFYWIGSFKGLWQYDTAMKLVKQWFKNLPGQVLVNSVLEDHEGKIWCGLWRGGIIRLDPPSGKMEYFLTDSSAAYNLKPHVVTDIIEDSKKNLWFASTDGLYRYERITKKFQQFLSGSGVINSEVDVIESLLEGSDGKIWIGSKQGLRYFDYNTGKISTIDFADNSVNDFISGIIEDENKTLWLATTNGLLHFDPFNKRLKQYNSTNGLPTNDLSLLFAEDKKGNIYIGSPGAVTVFNPTSLQKNSVAYPPIITGIAVDNKEWPVAPSSLKMRYDQSINVDFVALNYSNSLANQYAYWLEGIDKNWRPLGNNHTIYFANLPPGEYKLKIKAANSDGLWNETTTDLQLIVTPPFWKTWWFISLAALFVAATAYAFYRYRLQRAIELERLRTRIATDLHDDIGATLSSISMYSDAVKKQVKEKLPHLEPILNKMGENSREMVTNMSDIVWAISPGNDDGEKLVQRIEKYARDICAVKNVKLQFEGDEKLNESKLPLAHRKNIYFIFKEALNNSLKYSDAENISISIFKNGNNLFLSIKDDGKGFNYDTIKQGNGLKNMKARANEIEAEVEISSEPGRGTKVDFKCAL